MGDGCSRVVAAGTPDARGWRRLRRTAGPRGADRGEWRPRRPRRVATAATAASGDRNPTTVPENLDRWRIVVPYDLNPPRAPQWPQRMADCGRPATFIRQRFRAPQRSALRATDPGSRLSLPIRGPAKPTDPGSRFGTHPRAASGDPHPRPASATDPASRLGTHPHAASGEPHPRPASGFPPRVHPSRGTARPRSQARQTIPYRIWNVSGTSIQTATAAPSAS